MYKIPTELHGRDEALDMIRVLYMLGQEIEESINMALQLVTANTVTKVKSTLAIKQAKLSKVHYSVGVIVALHQVTESELRLIESEVYGYDPTLG